jgi:NAD(P)H-hydrate epimerase
MVEHLLPLCNNIVVIDADALNIIAEAKLTVSDIHADKILTPHEAEAARLLGTDASAVRADRTAAIRELSERFRATVVLKGHETLVAAPDGIIRKNPTGNPGMATAGSGDVLAGIITAFAGQGMPAETAAAAGVYTHGLAGDIAAGSRGEYGLIATDIVDAIPDALLTLHQKKTPTKNP